ncbi:MAG TPA: phytoene/squalene synthase family protein [Rhodanobacteraceae bacterium]
MPSLSPERIDPRDLDACRAALREGSKSFSAAARLLPSRVRDAATVLYAFCRIADDAIDVHGGSGSAVSDLRARLDAIYADAAHAPGADRALARVVATHALPRALLDALIEGFEWDAGHRRYANLGELEAYSARVAGTVGAMMSVLMGARDAGTVARACDLGIAMQLTNIARDVGEDARAGRLYLPLDRLRAAGVDADAWLADPQPTAGIRQVTRELVEHAARFYARADAGIARLPRDCRAGIRAARLIYAEIGAAVAAAGYESVTRRAVVSTERKLWLLGRAFTASVAGQARRDDEAAPSARYLVEAVARTVPRSAEGMPAAWWDVRGRALWLVDLFERVERRERTLMSSAWRIAPNAPHAPHAREAPS